jgi:dipeptide/tripeptide permease
MKSVLQAGWLFTVAVGNIIVLIVAEAAQLPDQVTTDLLTSRTL